MNKNNNNSSQDADIDYILTENFVTIHNFAFFGQKPIKSTKYYKMITRTTSIIDEEVEKHVIDVLV